jgi:hypothetical protein
MEKSIFTSRVCYCFSPLWFEFWLWMWGAFLVSLDLSTGIVWHHFFGGFLLARPWSSLLLVQRAWSERRCLFSISPLQLGLVFPAWKLCVPADFLLVSPQARAPVDGCSRSVLLPGRGPVPVSVVAGFVSCSRASCSHLDIYSSLRNFLSAAAIGAASTSSASACACACAASSFRWRDCLAYFSKLHLRLNLPAETTTSCARFCRP